MGKKVVCALLAIVAVAIYLTIREEGRKDAFGGALAPLESVRDEGFEPEDRPSRMDAMLAGESLPPSVAQDYGPLLDRMRTSVDDAMERSVERSSRY